MLSTSNAADIWRRLRDYQKQGVRDIQDAFRAPSRSVLYVAPTGSGKSVLFGFIATRSSERGKRALILVHRRELLRQTIAVFSRFGTPCGAIARDHPFEPDATIQVASSQLVARRIRDGRLDLEGWAPSLIVADESQHSVSPSLMAILDHWPQAKVLGVTATPARLDGKGLGQVFERMVLGPRPRPLIDQGWLADYVAYSHPAPEFDRRTLRKIAGDFRGAEMEQQLDTGTCLGDVVTHYERHLMGEPALAFCVSVDHAKHMARAFAERGHPAASLDGNMATADRDAALNAYERGELKVLTSCEILGEGLDVPETSGVILARPTASLTLHLQQIGRAFRRKADGRKAIILDHVGNLHAHGFPDDEHEWSLDGRVKPRAKKMLACPWCSCLQPAGRTFCETCQGYLAGPGAAGWKACGNCRSCHMHAYLDACPACGKGEETAGKPAGSRPRALDVMEGELAELRRQDLSWMTMGHIRFAVRRCRSLAQLTELARRREAAQMMTLQHGPLPWARWHWRRKLLETERDPARRAVLEADGHAARCALLTTVELATWYGETMGYSKGWLKRIITENGLDQPALTDRSRGA